MDENERRKETELLVNAWGDFVDKLLKHPKGLFYSERAVEDLKWFKEKGQLHDEVLEE